MNATKYLQSISNNNSVIVLCIFILQPNPLNVRTYRITRDHKTDLETSMIGIQFVITQQHFLNSNRLKVKLFVIFIFLRLISLIKLIFIEIVSKTKPLAYCVNGVTWWTTLNMLEIFFNIREPMHQSLNTTILNICRC